MGLKIYKFYSVSTICKHDPPTLPDQNAYQTSASISVPSGYGTNQPPSYGFVTMWDGTAARDAAEELSGREVRGHRILVRSERNLQKHTWGDIC